MVETFKNGDLVECKAGVGTITYFEDDYMDIELKNGTERSFFAPFEGKVWPYVKPVPMSELPVWDEILKRVPELTLAEAWTQSMVAGMAVRILGGQAKEWDELRAYNKVHYISLITGCPVSIFREAYENGQIETIIEKWCKLPARKL